MVVFPVKKQFYLIISPNSNSETAESFGKVELNLASTPSLECLRRQYSGKVEPDLECLRRRLLEEPLIRLHVQAEAKLYFSFSENLQPRWFSSEIQNGVQKIPPYF